MIPEEDLRGAVAKVQVRYMMDQDKSKQQLIEELAELRQSFDALVNNLLEGTPLEIDAGVIDAKEGKRIISLCRDITARKQAEQALRQSEEKYRSLVEACPDLIVVRDMEGRVLYTSRQAWQWLGLPESEELLGRSVFDYVIPEDRARLAANMAELLRVGVQKNIEYTALRPDGGTVCTEVSSAVMRDVEGQPKAVVSVIRDVAERKEAESVLRESDERVRTICDSALDAVVMVDQAGKALYWNPAAEKMFGYSCQEILGREVHGILTPARYRDRAREAFSEFEALGRGRAVGTILELTALRKDGTEFPIEIAVSGFIMSDRRCAAAVIRDITDRKRAEEALERERGTLRRLLESSDHERHLISCEIHDGLAQELVGALMQFDGYKAWKDANPERAAEALALGMQLVRAGHAEARQLIGGLRLPHIDEGVLVAIEDLVDECNERYKVEIEFCSNVTQLTLAPMLENTVFRIVQECLTNACRHSKSTKVKVELTQHDDQLRIKVQDWGVGFKVDKVGDGHFGLEGIQERAKVFGGHTVIESAPGNGTDIIVELPLSFVSTGSRQPPSTFMA